MDTKQVVEILKKESDSNPASKAALMVFCLRDRPRSTLTLLGLEHRMKAEGFDHSKEEYIPLLKALVAAGIGQLTYADNGSILGIQGVDVTFLSIGEAVFKGKEELEKFKQRKKFKKLPPAPRAKVVPINKSQPELVTKPKSLSIGLQISLNGKLLSIPVPTNFSNEDLSELIGRFKH